MMNAIDEHMFATRGQVLDAFALVPLGTPSHKLLALVENLVWAEAKKSTMEYHRRLIRFVADAMYYDVMSLEEGFLFMERKLGPGR